MNQRELLETVTKVHGDINDASLIVQCLFEEIENYLEIGEGLKIESIGVLGAHAAKIPAARNKQKGFEPEEGSKIIFYHPSSKIKERVAEVAGDATPSDT